MRKILTLAAAVASLFAVGAARAAIILVDDFNTPAVTATISDTTADSVAVAQTTSTGGASIAATRTVSVNLTQKNTSAAAISASVGGADGFLNFSVTTGDNGVGKVKWSLPTFSLPTSGNSYFFSVIASALGATPTGSAPNAVTFDFAGTGTNAGNNFSLLSNIGFVFFQNPGTAVNFGLDTVQSAAISGGGDLTLTVAGGQAWNLTLDQFAISIPEPTSLALVGLALVGAGFAAKRRKA